MITTSAPMAAEGSSSYHQGAWEASAIDSAKRSSVVFDAPQAPPGGDAKRLRLADQGVGTGNAEWKTTISALQPAIVALRVTTVRPFEEDPASCALGTGFVVDKERGIILTNRHVAGVGPVRAVAHFDRHEELEVEVLYRDPIHDFGFFRYDPKKLRLTSQVEIKLDPGALAVGAEIRVVGNDAGEKLQILSGTIARVDRNVPEFSAAYNDENTFYIGAGAGTSGGSSGSPVLNAEGKAVGLNAAGQEGTCSAYFLPLHRVQFALEHLQAGRPVPRGTVLTCFMFKPFDELHRVGLQQTHEREVLSCDPSAIGMLLVDKVMCEQEYLRVGDILLHLNGKVCAGFVELEAELDAHVGGIAEFHVCRAGKELRLEVPVKDLHAFSPRSFFELGLDVVHDIGYHTAKKLHMPVSTGVYVARPGFIFGSLSCGHASLIVSVNDSPTPTLEAFIEAMRKIQDRQYFPVTWYELTEFRSDRTLRTGFAKMSRAWSPMKVWRCLGANSAAPECWHPTDVPREINKSSTASLNRAPAISGGNRLVQRLQASLVSICFRTDRRFTTEAPSNGKARGFGLVVDANNGLVLTDRHSAPQSLGDVEVTLGGTTTLDAEVVYVHPHHNIALVRYDPSCMPKGKNNPVRSATLGKGAKAGLRPGENVCFVGYDSQGNTFSTEVTVSAVYLPSGRDAFPFWDYPRFREKNLEIVVLADTPEDARGGVLCDSNGTVRALLAAFDWQDTNREETTDTFGICVNVFDSVVDTMRRNPGCTPLLPTLDLEVQAVDVAALARGATCSLPKAWLEGLVRRCAGQGQVARALRVLRVLPTGTSDGILKPGDVLLSIDGHAVLTCVDIEKALERSAMQFAQRLQAAQGKGRGRRSSSASAGSRSTAPSTPRGRSRGQSVGSAGKKSSPSMAGLPQEADASIYTEWKVSVKVLRNGHEHDLLVSPGLQGSQDDSQLVLWAGLVLRKTPRCILERCGEALACHGNGVFAQNVMGGSPADAREFHSHWFLKEIDGHLIEKLDDVTKTVQALQSSSTDEDGRSWVRVRYVDWLGQEHVGSLQCDPLFFPTLDLKRDGSTGGWKCTQH